MRAGNSAFVLSVVSFLFLRFPSQSSPIVSTRVTSVQPAPSCSGSTNGKGTCATLRGVCGSQGLCRDIGPCSYDCLCADGRTGQGCEEAGPVKYVPIIRESLTMRINPVDSLDAGLFDEHMFGSMFEATKEQTTALIATSPAVTTPTGNNTTSPSDSPANATRIPEVVTTNTTLQVSYSSIATTTKISIAAGEVQSATVAVPPIVNTTTTIPSTSSSSISETLAVTEITPTILTVKRALPDSDQHAGVTVNQTAVQGISNKDKSHSPVQESLQNATSADGLPGISSSGGSLGGKILPVFETSTAETVFSAIDLLSASSGTNVKSDSIYGQNEPVTISLSDAASRLGLADLSFSQLDPSRKKYLTSKAAETPSLSSTGSDVMTFPVPKDSFSGKDSSVFPPASLSDGLTLSKLIKN